MVQVSSKELTAAIRTAVRSIVHEPSNIKEAIFFSMLERVSAEAYHHVNITHCTTSCHDRHGDIGKAHLAVPAGQWSLFLREASGTGQPIGKSASNILPDAFLCQVTLSHGRSPGDANAQCGLGASNPG